MLLVSVLSHDNDKHINHSTNSNNGFSFTSNGFESPLFSSEEECFIALLKYHLHKQALLLYIKGLSPELGTKIDLAFGQGFSHKFSFANKKINTFIGFAFEKASQETQFFAKITFLIAPFNKITYQSPQVILFDIPTQTNPKVNQFFTSKKFVDSPNWNHVYQPGDISFFCDASCENYSTLAGAAMQNKHLICAFRKKITLEDNNLAELKAILETIQLALSMEIPTLLLYTDNANAIDFISGACSVKENNHHFFILAKQINDLLKNFTSYHLAWIPRKKNFIADNLSKKDFSGLFFQR